ncbi:MAG: dihydrolipoyllysine-residue acetyltransferase [Xanthomonadales bacterium]|nr:dihydrolipoyllysine-residue acetyltransferase [Xanthomonadales bacterium]
MAEEIKVPDIGDFDDVEIIEVLVSPGDSVEADDSLITLESDKASMEVPAPKAGKVTEVKVEVGGRVSEGDVICLLEAEDGEDSQPVDGDEEETSEAEEETSDEKEKKTEESRSEQDGEEEEQESESGGEEKSEPRRDPQAEPPKPVADRGPTAPPVSFDASRVLPEKVPHASPAVRKFARELGVDLAEVQGSGRAGRITTEDVQAHVKQAMRAKGEGASPAVSAGFDVAPWPKVDFSKHGEIETQPLSRIKKISGANLSRNWVMIPHVTQHDEADITEMEAFRKSHAEEAKAKGFKLTPLAFLIKAVVAALKEFPDFNASLDASGENLVLKKYFHVGVAVDTPDGLVVPVIRDCDRKSLYELAEDVVAASVKARDKKLSPGDMQGGCFSISSLGGIGGTAFTPIINAPEVAILGVSRSYQKPVWQDGEFVPRLMLPMSLSYDHRVIDGASAARFTSYLSYVLSDLRRLLL